MGILPKLNAHLKIVAERDGNIQWFVLNYIPSIVARHETAEAVVGRFNKVNDEELELFAPTFVKMVETGGKLKRIETPLFSCGEAWDVSKIFVLRQMASRSC